MQLLPESHADGQDVSRNAPSQIPVGHITPYSFESASTPVLDKLLEQLSSSDNTAPFEDFEFPYGPTPTPTQNDVQGSHGSLSTRSLSLSDRKRTLTVGADSAARTVMGDETVFGNYENHFPGLETLIWNAHQNNLIQDWAAWTPSSSESRRGSSSSQSIFGPLLARIVAEENEVRTLLHTGRGRKAHITRMAKFTRVRKGQLLPYRFSKHTSEVADKGWSWRGSRTYFRLKMSFVSLRSCRTTDPVVITIAWT